MAFDPNAYLAQKSQGQSQGFDPDAYLSQKTGEQPKSWGDVAESAAVNFLPSVGHMIGGVAESVLHPIDTATNLGKLVVGAGEAGAEKLAGMVNPELVAFNKQLNAPSESQQMAQNVGSYYAQKYGTEEGFKKALAEDPAGVLADAATVLSAGGGLASKLPTIEQAGNVLSKVPALQQAGIVLSKLPGARQAGETLAALPSGAEVGSALSKAGSMVDPLALTAKAVGGATNIAGKYIAKPILGMTTGAGSEAIGEAYQAGKAGGEQAQQFAENLRGNVPKTDVLNEIDANIQAMGKAKSQAYQDAMAQLGEYDKPIPFDAIKQATQDAMGVQTFTGPKSGIKVSTATSTLPMQQKISDLVNKWDTLPDDFKTPAGLDALKKSIGDLRDSAQFGTPERLVADKVYHAVKNTIVKEAPEYSAAMKDYQEASDLISEIRSTLSQKPNASVDTQMRKLQSLMRNNVNTSYGNRLDLVREMEQQGGRQVIPAVAGQALSTWAPRGIQSATTLPAAIMAGGLAGLGPAAATLGMASPRLVGEAAYLAGRTPRLAQKGANALSRAAMSTAAQIPVINRAIPTVNRLAQMIKANPRLAANLAYQAQQPKR